jgi:predicted nucleic-acid-binding protein
VNAFVADTNCLISYVTDRSPQQMERISALIEEAANLRHVICIISNVVTEFVYVLQTVYEKDDRFIAQMLMALFATPGIEYSHAYSLDNILKLWPTPIKDYGDAVLAAAAAEMRVPVLTFDRSFAAQLRSAQIPCELLT